MLKWAIEISSFDLQYVPRSAIKGQVVADIPVDLTPPSGEVLMTENEDGAPNLIWTLNVDGASNRKGAGAGLEGVLPESKFEARKHKQRAARYWMSSMGILYKKSFQGPYLKCVRPREAQRVLKCSIQAYVGDR
ncbi:hypothetical protein QJS10_CPB13g01121 [Acorus calamus]|uniref:Uncharacterized protein n=1 Tax=Acorus calamus TaxID=4465 RepID=A0AAV9DH75_ACOCL|nr:hypothetical protein QJS10_CPB13g01121 [Acorus calamus]